MTHHDGVPASRSRLTYALILAYSLVAFALGLAWITRSNTDIGPVLGAIHGDARIASLVRLAADTLALAAVLALLSRVFSFRTLALFGAGLLLTIGLAPLAPRPVALPFAFGGAVPVPAGPTSPLLAYPFGRWFWAVLVWYPALVTVACRFLKRPAAADRLVIPVLALFLVTLVLALRHAPSTLVTELLFANLALNAACIIDWPFVPAAIYTTLIAIALIDPVAARIPQLTGPALDSYAAVALRLAALHAHPPFETQASRSDLPDSLRPPLAAVDSGLAVTGGADPGRTPFRAAEAPNLPGRDDLPSWSTYSATGPARTGAFRSAPLTTTASLLQIRVAGTLSPPDTDLYLEAADGRIIRSLEPKLSALTRWHRLNFPAPHGLFTLVATSRVTDRYLAFTAPTEVTRESWLANKLARSWPWWIVAALAVFTICVPPLATAFQESPLLPTVSAPALLGLSLFAYGVFFSHHVDATAGPNDSGGYLNSAKLLAHHAVTATPRIPRPLDAADLAPFTPITFVAAPNHRLAPTYPVGFPLVVAAVGQFLPLATAVPAVILLQLALGALFTYLLARAVGFSIGYAWAAGTIIGLSPVYLFQGLQPQSDGPALVWVTAAIYLAYTSRQATAKSSHPFAKLDGAGRAYLAGLATALAILVRPSNTLCLIPLLLILADRPRALLRWAAGGIPGAAFLLWYNHHLYGHALDTGYGGASDVAAGFGTRFILPTLQAYARNLPLFFTPAIVLAVAGPFLPSVAARLRVILAGWVLVYFTFYALYWCTYDNWYNMRFILPAAPALVLLALFAARALCARLALPAGARIAALVLLLGVSVAVSGHERITYWMQANGVPADAARWAKDHLPKNAVIFGKHETGSLMYYTDLPFVRTDTPLARDPATYAVLARAGRPIYAITFHWETPGFTWGHGKGNGFPALPGTWTQIAALDDNEVHVWKRQ